MAKAEGASIYIDAQALRKLLIRSLHMMTKQNRIEIGSRAVQESGELIAAFVMAYDFEEERWYYFRRPCPGRVETFLSTVNSYLGIMKNAGDDYAVGKVLEAVSPRWRRYVFYDGGRRCFNALPGYTHAELLARRYKISINKLKRKRHDDNRENQRN